jgi:hypothetical protein
MPPPGTTAPETRARPALHPLVYTALAGVGLLLVFMAIGIGMLVVILKDSRDHIRAQDKKTAVLLQKVQAAQPTASQVPELLDQARPVVRRLGRAAKPVEAALTSTARATEQLPELARITEALAHQSFPVLSDIREADLAATPPLIRELLHIQRVTLDVQRRSLRTQLTTLEIQREALKHIESIDRKTGGTVPAEGAPVPQP